MKNSAPSTGPSGRSEDLPRSDEEIAAETEVAQTVESTENKPGTVHDFQIMV